MMKRLLILFLCIGFSVSLQAQSRASHKRANKLYHKYAFAKAIKAYEKVHAQYPTDSLRIRIAECYTKLNQPQETAAWYAKVQDTKSLSPAHYLAFGSALESLGRYEEALAWYQKCATANPTDSRIPYKIKGIEQHDIYFQDSARFTISLMGFNTEGYEFAPAFFKQGIAFASSRPREGRTQRNFQWDNTPFLDIYYAQEYRQGRFAPPIPFPNKINSIMHEGALAFNRNFSRIVFTRNNYYEHKKGTSDEKVNMLKMYFAERDLEKKEDEAPFSWIKLQEFPFNSDQYSVGDPTVNQDFTRIIFTSDMPGGKGGTDLYESTFKDGEWSEPVNLGLTFNTEGHERSPFLHEDGRIFFASDGRDGLGGLDMYVATPTADGYTVQNMGYPINSPMDDFSLILDDQGKRGYFSSNRKGGAGLDDIYGFSIKEIPEEEKPEADERLAVCFEVRNKDTDSLMANVQVHMMNVEAKAIRTFVTDQQGKVCTELRRDTQYVVKAGKAKFLSNCMFIMTTDSLSGNVQAERPLLLEPLKVAQKFVYNAVYFDLDEFGIRADAAEELDKIVDFIQSHPGITVELSSHTDSRASNMYNEALSLKRAKSSREYIISQGVHPDAITAKGYGEYMLTNDCDDGVPCTEEQHQQNRRTEIKITGIREVNPEQEAKLRASGSPLNPAQDYSESCEQVKLIPALKQISVK